MTQLFRIPVILAGLFSFSFAAAAELNVGSAQAYTSIQSALDEAAAGDLILIHEGTYTENIVIKADGITLRKYAGERPRIIGNIEVGSSNDVTIAGLEIAGWSTGSGINQHGGSGFTVKDCIIHDGPTGGSFAGIATRFATRVSLIDNEIYNCVKGIKITSGHSPDGTYKNGVLIEGNYIHDNPIDGINIQGQYIVIDGNRIENNLDANFKANHPDGIQFIASNTDGFATVQHCIIRNNIIKNHTQNVFISGVPNNPDLPGPSDIHIYNNVIYNTRGNVNGVDMDSLNTKNIGASHVPVKDLYIYNNTLGRATNNSILISVAEDGAVHIKNNIIANDAGAGLSIENPNGIPSGELDHNLWHVTGKSVIVWNQVRYSSLSEFRAAVTNQSRNCKEEDPLFKEGWPKVEICCSSPAIDQGATLSSGYDVDLKGNKRPNGSAWDIGAVESEGLAVVAPSAPRNLRIVGQ